MPSSIGALLRRPAMPLILSTDLQHDLLRHAREALPAEACGLLVGERLPGDAGLRVQQVLRLANATRALAEDHFELDPVEHLAAENAARAAGLEVLGCWHSHPESGPRPSSTDLARAREAGLEGWSYTIVGPAAAPAPAVRSWRLRGALFGEEPILIAAPEPAFAAPARPFPLETSLTTATR